MTATLDNPGAVVGRLVEIEQDLAVRQGALEHAALSWFRAKRDREHRRAVAFIRAQGTVAQRSAEADQETCLLGVAEEAEYEALRAVVRVLETRSNIGMALLKSQGRVGFS
jgi:hypothetical protein